jgi:hypothetical protein
MVRRRANAAVIATRIGNHTFRATGITAYLKNAGKLEVAQHIANHESPSRQEQPSFTIGEATTFPSMKLNGSGFEAADRIASVFANRRKSGLVS